jgi:hypothetical protein
MAVLRTYVIFGSAVHLADTIEHEGKLWLVPHWLDTPDGKWTMPARIIRLDTLRHAKFYGPADFVVHDPMPTELFDVRTPKQPIEGFEFHELPEIRIPRADRS